MALLNCSFYSYELGLDTPFQVIFPESRLLPQTPSDKKYKVLYCLHGHSRDCTTFSRYGTLEHLLCASDVIAVVPYGARSFYMDEKNGYRYYTYLTQELPTLIENTFPVSRSAEDRYLCGFSMGGYGALRAAFLNPDRYAGAAAFSVGSEPFESMDIMLELGLGTVPDLMDNMDRIFGSREEAKQTDANLEVALETALKAEHKPIIYHACGKQDFLYDMNQRLRKTMEERYPAELYTYHEEDGWHDWYFWNAQLKRMAELFHFI